MSQSDVSLEALLRTYETGPEQLMSAVAGLSDDQLDAQPVAGRWSVRQVICHLADFEIVYADRMKRVLAEDNPTLMSGDPNDFARRLNYASRNVGEELQLIHQIRRHVAGILRSCDVEEFQRTGVHSTDGPLTLETLLERVTGHVPHHLTFIEEKRRLLLSN
ncbi:MAG: DinB family protein [Planctomycetaceae bacterium]